MKNNFKKFNNRGFTLIELLAVIIILAIVVGITIPSVLNSVSGAKEKAFQTSLDTMADWIERQYQIAQVSDTSVGTVSTYLTDSTVCGSDFANCTSSDGKKVTNKDSQYDNLLKSAGVKPNNYSYVTLKVDSDTGRVCVKATASDSGDFQNLGGKESSGC